MPHFKQFRLILILSSPLFLCVICDDWCHDVYCDNYGTCVDGDCICQDGYEGWACQDQINTKFAADYSSLNSCDTSSTYTTTITANQGVPSLISISNLTPGVLVHGYVASYGTDFSFPGQTVSGNLYTGSGTIAIDSTITLAYTVVSGSTTDSCVVTMLRQ